VAKSPHFANVSSDLSAAATDMAVAAAA
jgi:hypothetical protein